MECYRADKELKIYECLPFPALFFSGHIGYSLNAKLKCYLKIGNGNIGAGFTNNCKKISGLLCKSPAGKIAKCSFKKFKCDKVVSHVCWAI